MKKSRKALIVGLSALAIAAVIAIAGCSSSSSSSSSSTSSSTGTASTTSASSTSSTTSAKVVTLQIFAANSLQKALPEVQALYTKNNPNVTFADTQFEASGTLVKKLASGGTADIFIGASKGSMDDAVTNGSVDEATRADMFLNDLVICEATNANYTITDVKDLATSDQITSIAMGEPNTVPAGKYALQTLESAGLVTYTTDSTSGTISDYVWADSIASKMNYGADKVGTVASYVQQGTCQVGFVYTSDIYRYDGIKVAYTVPADMHKKIVYPGAVCTSTTNAEAAQAFLTFCTTDPDAIAIFQQYGFELAS